VLKISEKNLDLGNNNENKNTNKRNKVNKVNKWHLGITLAAWISFITIPFSAISFFHWTWEDIKAESISVYIFSIFMILNGVFLIFVNNIIASRKIRLNALIKKIFNALTCLFFILIIIGGVGAGVIAIWGNIEDQRLINATEKEPYLTWTLNTSSSITITWETREPQPSILSYGLSSSSLNQTINDSALKTHHTFTLTGLSAGTKYFYKVNGFDKIYDFRTAKDPSTNPIIRFIVYGDNRYDSDRIVGPFADENPHPEIISKIQEMYTNSMDELDYNFTINVGDFVWRGGVVKYWNKFFQEIAPIASSRPYMIAFGNHEYYGGDTQFTEMDLYHARQYWVFNNESGDEKDYWFALGNCMFLVFGSGEDGQVTPEQVEWINQTLTTYGPNYDWIFTFDHHPFYSHDFVYTNLTESLEQLFISNNVDVSIMGHVHDYQRLVDPIKNWTQIITGGGGASLRDKEDNNIYPNATMRMYHFMEWTIEKNKATAKVILKDGTIWEQFTLWT